MQKVTEKRIDQVSFPVSIENEEEKVSWAFINVWKICCYLVVYGSFNDDEILNKADDEGECSEEPNLTVTSREAKSGLHTILHYLHRHDIDNSLFCDILNLNHTSSLVSWITILNTISPVISNAYCFVIS